MAIFITLDNLGTFLAQCKNLFVKGSDVYSKGEVDALVSAIKSFSYEVVTSLPTASSATMGKIYLIPSSSPATQNVKDEYITLINNGTYSWEKIGSTDVNLDGYVTDGDLDAIVSTLAKKTDIPSNLVLLGDGNLTPSVEEGLAARVASFDASKQDKLVPGVNIKTINGESILGTGDIQIQGSGSSVTEATISGWGFTKNTGTYSKPSGGIPKSDLSDDIKISLTRADEIYNDYITANSLI